MRLNHLLPTFALAATVLGQADSPAVAAAKANTAFACDLYTELAKKPGNLFFSPYSISAALGMTRTGAAGRTATQMDAVLHTARVPVAKGHGMLAVAMKPPKVRRRDAKPAYVYDLRIANALWGQSGFGFAEEFLGVLDKEFGAPLQRIDFAQNDRARKIINGWVEDNTENKIKDIVPPGLPTPDTRLVLANAVYFKAKWAQQFEKFATRPAKFTVDARESLRVHMMHRVDQMRHGSTDVARFVEIPYQGHHLAMLVVLPKQRGKLKAVEAQLSAKTIAKWVAGMKTVRVGLKLPRFEFTAKAPLTDILPKMGMSDAFDAARADFSGMTKEEPLYIGAVLHKAFVAVDEHGTEAAAATVVMMKPGSAIMERPEKPVPFVADQPFWFCIRHRQTGCVLFAGRVTSPTPAR